MSGLFERVTGSNDTDDLEDEVETVGCSLDEACTVLSNERRRVLIRHVATLDATETVTLAEVIDYVSEVEFGPEYTSEERKAVYVALYQTHVDDLVDIDVLEPAESPANGIFRAGPNATPLARVIDELDARTGGAQ